MTCVIKNDWFWVILWFYLVCHGVPLWLRWLYTYRRPLSELYSCWPERRLLYAFPPLPLIRTKVACLVELLSHTLQTATHPVRLSDLPSARRNLCQNNLSHDTQHTRWTDSWIHWIYFTCPEEKEPIENAWREEALIGRILWLGYLKRTNQIVTASSVRKQQLEASSWYKVRP